MWEKRIKELIATGMIGDGVQNFIAPRNHALLRLVGPEGLRKALLRFAENPRYARLIGVVQIGFGIYCLQSSIRGSKR
ncbi:MAG: hypothetical protein JOZ19_02965 [Rubrobacter sp.]|nr:hypothetical protein [Rubrobacter sp.]